MSPTSAGDKDVNDAIIDTGIGAVENAEENVEVFLRVSATQGSRKHSSIAKSQKSRKRQIDEMELENLRAKKETEQQLELEQERKEMELRQRKEQQEQEDELRLRQMNESSKTKERKLMPTKSKGAWKLK